MVAHMSTDFYQFNYLRGMDGMVDRARPGNQTRACQTQCARNQSAVDHIHSATQTGVIPVPIKLEKTDGRLKLAWMCGMGCRSRSLQIVSEFWLVHYSSGWTTCASFNVFSTESSIFYFSWVVWSLFLSHVTLFLMHKAYCDLVPTVKFQTELQFACRFES